MNELALILLVVGLCVMCALGVGAAALAVFLYSRAPRAVHPWQDFAGRTGLHFDVERFCVTGVYRGRSLRLETVNHFNPLGADTTGTRMTLTVKNPAGNGLTVESGSGAGKLGRLFGVAEVKVGDPVLDRAYTIRSQPPTLAAQVLLAPVIHRRLQATPYVKLALEGEALMEDYYQYVADCNALLVMAAWLSDVADVLDHLQRTS